MGWFDFLKEMFVSRDSGDEAAAKAILRKRFNNNKSLEEEKYIYDHWKRLRIDAENCDVLNERATFDLQKIKDTLKEKLGFNGLVISDCMEMKAMQTYFGTAESAAAAINAGIELIFISHPIPTKRLSS